ncbi:MAG: glycosyltransferase family 2 protein [Patescibacteria group bacterium]
MWHGKTVSVVVSTYRERDSIRQVINNYFATGFVDEIVIVNNNAQEGTDEEVKKTKARLIYETKQGYGHGYQTGIREAKGDYIFLTEADGTYAARDLEKFLVYAKDFPAVFGTRTNQSAILEGASMGLFRKLANVFEAKTIEVLFATNSLTEIGCTCKLFERSILKQLEPLWKTTNALFATELLLLTISQRIKFIEIPITFSERVGESQLTARWHQLAKWGLKIFWFILSFWFLWVIDRKPKRVL